MSIHNNLSKQQIDDLYNTIALANGWAFINDANFIHQDDTHSKEPHLYQGKSYLSDTPIVESENGCGASSNTETEIERCRQRLLLREYKKVEEVVLALKDKHKILPQIREARLLKRLTHVVENFLNTLVVLQYLPKEQ